MALGGVVYLSIGHGELDNSPLGVLHFFVLISVAYAAAASLYRALKTYKFMSSEDYNALPTETIPRVLICARCEEAYPPDVVNDGKCGKCGGHLEESDGFYKRHPQFKRRQEHTEDQGFLKRLKNDYITARNQSKHRRPSVLASQVMRDQRAVRGGIPRLIILVVLLLAALAFAIYEIPRAWHEFLKSAANQAL